MYLARGRGLKGGVLQYKVTRILYYIIVHERRAARPSSCQHAAPPSVITTQASSSTMPAWSRPGASLNQLGSSNVRDSFASHLD